MPWHESDDALPGRPGNFREGQALQDVHDPAAVNDEWQPPLVRKAIRVGSFWERAVTLIQHSRDFLPEPHGGADFMVRYGCFTDSGALS